jgi:hypothetical protein
LQQFNAIRASLFVIVADETIETVVRRPDNDNIQLLCRVANMRNLLKYCRFERLSDGFGLSLEDGMATDSYRYFGQGLIYGDCGMEIKTLKSLDRAQWRCFVGLMDAEDIMKNIPESSKRIYKHSALLDASDEWNKLKGLCRISIVLASSIQFPPLHSAHRGK